jgi:hypothetical protein
MSMLPALPRSAKRPWSIRSYHSAPHGQREPEQPAAAGLEGDDVFPSRGYDPTEGDHVHFDNRLTNDREGILFNLAVGGEIVG